MDTVWLLRIAPLKSLTFWRYTNQIIIIIIIMKALISQSYCNIQ